VIEGRAAATERRAAVIEGRAAVTERRAAVIERRAAVIERRAAVIEGRAAVIEGRAAVIEGLSPVDPTKELVIQGLYRYVRNPMYLAVSTILLGEALLVRSRGLLGYWVIFFAAVNLFVMAYEEPTLRRRFGESYTRYQERVGRWLPRIGA